MAGNKGPNQWRAIPLSPNSQQSTAGKTTMQSLTAQQKAAIQNSFLTFLTQEKKTYKDVDQTLIDAFLAWEKTHEQGKLLQTLTNRELEKVKVDFSTIIDKDVHKKLHMKTQQALIDTSIDSLHTAFAAQHAGQPLFDPKIQSAFDTLFAPHTFQDIELFESTFATFLQNNLPSLADEQKKAVDKARSIRMADIFRTLHVQKVISDQELTDITQQWLSAANADVQHIVSDIFSTVLIPGEISVMGKEIEESVQAVSQAFTRIPWMWSLLKWYDFSLAELRKADPTYQVAMDNPALSQYERQNAALKAMAKVIESKDKKLSTLIDTLVDKNFQLGSASREQQQYYLDSIKQQWLESKEGKEMTDMLAWLKISEERKKWVVDQLFDLSTDKIVMTNDKGEKFTMPLRKHITTTWWKGDTLSEQINFPLPLVFELDGNTFSGDDDDMKEKILRLLGSHKEKDAFDRNGVRIVPGHTLKISDKRDPANDLSAYKYARLDPEKKNILLYKTPASTEFLVIDKKNEEQYVVAVEKPTYHVSGWAFPSLVTLLMQVKHESEMSDEKKQAWIDEWNKDYIEEAVSDTFGKDANSDEEKNNRLREVDRNDETSKQALSSDEVEYAERTLREELVALDTEKKQIESQIYKHKTAIEKLESQIAQLQQQQPVNAKKLQQLEKQIADKKLALAQSEQKLQEADEQIANTASLHQKVAKEKTRRDNLPENVKAAILAAENEKQTKDLDAARKNFRETWKGLYGDESLTAPEVGQVLLCQLPDAISPFPGASATWIQAEIVDVTKEWIVVKWSGVEGKLANCEWSTSTVSLLSKDTDSGSGMEEFRKSFSKVYKMPKQTDLVSWGMTLKDPNTKLKFDKKYMDWVKMMQQKVDFSSMVKQGEGDKKEDVKYFGSIVGEERLRYKVNLAERTVGVEWLDRKGNMVRQEMDLNGFMIFAAEKGIHPYSQEDVDRANGTENAWLHYIISGDKNIDRFYQPDSRKWNRWQRNMISIASIASSWKDIKGGITTYFDDKKKKDATRAKNKMLKSKWFASAKKLPFGIGTALDDMGAGISAKLDNEKTKKITEYKEDVDKNKSTGGSWGTNYIIDTLFEAPGEANSTPLKSAGYFLWALENGWPYIRSLAKYEKDAMWVKSILGEKTVPSYRKYMERMRADSATSTDAALAVAKGELWFLQYYFQSAPKEIQGDLTSIFGEKYFGWTLGAATYGLWYNKSKIQEEYNAESWKWSFSDIALDAVYNDRVPWGAYFDYISQDRMRNHIGAVKAMAEKVWPSQQNYNKWMAAMVYPFIAGKVETKMADPFKDEFKGIGRKTAFAFTQYTTDPKAQEKVTKIINILSKDFTNIDGSSGQLGKNLNTKDPKKQAETFYKRWVAHSDQLLKMLNDPSILIRTREAYRVKPGERDQQKMNTFALLNEFIEDKMQDTDAGSFGDDLAGDSAIMENHIYNATTGLVSSQMTKASNGAFTGAAAKNGQKLWESMNNKILNVWREVEGLKKSGDKAAAARIYAYTMRNFFRQFGEKLSGEEAKKNVLVAMHHYDLIKSKTDEDPLQYVVRGKYDTKMNGEALPDVMNQWFKNFESFFLKHKDLIDYAYSDMNRDILEMAIGKEISNPRKVYYESTPDKLVAQTSNRKEFTKKVKMLQWNGVDPSLLYPQITDDDEDDDDDDEDVPFWKQAA